MSTFCPPCPLHIVDGRVKPGQDELLAREIALRPLRKWRFCRPSPKVAESSAMLTNKGKYGLKAMVHLAGADPNKPVLVSEIAEQNGIPKKFLDAILGELRNAGFVRSRKGPGGGYTLARAPQEIRIGHVIRALDGPLAPIACASRAAYQPCEDCPDIERCAVRLVMLQVRDAISAVLDQRTLAELRGMSDVARLEFVYSI